MPRRLTVLLNKYEDKALLEMAKQDVRPPWEEVRWLLIKEAERRGLLTAEKSENGGAKDSEAQRAAVLS